MLLFCSIAPHTQLLCLGQAALGDGDIHAGSSDPVTSGNSTEDPFPLFCGWLSFHMSSRINSFLEVHLEALEHLLFNVLMRVASKNNIAVFTNALKSSGEPMTPKLRSFRHRCDGNVNGMTGENQEKGPTPCARRKVVNRGC
jgi:hypothetical protein